LRQSADASRNASLKVASRTIEAREKDRPFRVQGNVMNNHSGAGQLIINLAVDSCVDGACLVDGNGINPSRRGTLPRQMANLWACNRGMFDLGEQAAIEPCKDAAIHALILDPLCAAVCTPTKSRRRRWRCLLQRRPVFRIMAKISRHHFKPLMLTRLKGRCHHTANGVYRAIRALRATIGPL